jgi:uncharacterized protein (TIGR02646 family)
MRYIQKRVTPRYITDWIDLRKSADQKIIYNEFDQKPKLNSDLREDQHHICCYCQQILTHYRGDKNGGSHNEHLIPENGTYANFAMQMDYDNIFACCIDSSGMEKKSQHCGEAKKYKLIRGVIQEKYCSILFKYNSLGEIIPNGDFETFEDYKAYKANLPKDQFEILELIERLNLNCTYLVNERKKDQTALIKVLNQVTKARVEQQIQAFENEPYFRRFIDMLLYYMRQKK